MLNLQFTSTEKVLNEPILSFVVFGTTPILAQGIVKLPFKQLPLAPSQILPSLIQQSTSTNLRYERLSMVVQGPVYSF